MDLLVVGGAAEVLPVSLSCPCHPIESSSLHHRFGVNAERDGSDLYSIRTARCKPVL
jgi:hypothetical protein